MGNRVPKSENPRKQRIKDPEGTLYPLGTRVREIPSGQSGEVKQVNPTYSLIYFPEERRSRAVWNRSLERI